VLERRGAAPRRRQPRARGPRDRRLHADEGVRRPRRRPVPRVLRGLDARRRGDPREDGQRLAARVTENDPERRKKALEFQSVVDKLFSYGGTRSDSEESPIGLARRFRELAGFTDTEVEEIAEVSMSALVERKDAIAKMKSAAEQLTPG
jgi:hypothetical protein